MLIGLWTILCLLLPVTILCDEEDPLQHVAQVAARERKLTNILHLLNQSYESPQHVIAKACTHEVLDFQITRKQLTRFNDAETAALRVANLLNNLFLSLPNDKSVDSAYPPRVFYALVRACLEAEASLVSVGVAFLRGEFDPLLESNDGKPPSHVTFGAYSFRNGDHVEVENLSTLYDHSYDQSDQPGTKWFTQLSYRHPLRSLDAFVNSVSPTLTMTHQKDGIWTLEPFFDCGGSNQWVVAYSMPFFGKTNDGASAKLKGVVMVTIPLKKIDIIQCDDSVDLLEHRPFGGTHKCESISTQCIPEIGMGFVRGAYKCVCRSTHYIPNSDVQYFNGTIIEENLASHKSDTNKFKCWPCPTGCLECSGSRVCKVQYDSFTRLIPVCLQTMCVLLCCILSIVIFKLRRCKVIATSLWTLLEVTLIGGIIIYSSVFLRYVEPTLLLCLISPCVREIGFALFYGAIVLKLYRILVEHRTRKAHRYVIRDRDLLRYLAGLIVFVIGYLSAWIAFSGQLSMEGHQILDTGRTSDGVGFSVCRTFWWDYVTEAGELLFVLFGLYLSWQLRKAARDTKDMSELRERRAMAASLCCELIVSGSLYVARYFIMLKAHPDHVFLAYFIRTHLTITVSLALIIMPKLCCSEGVSGREASRRALHADGSQELRLCEAIANGEIEAAHLSQMDPEEIRSELRRVYTQLEELKSRTMRKDNPHISKRRGGRKPTHRRFSVQSRKETRDKHTKRNRHHPFDSAFESDMKTPEESVCSIEGPSVLSVYADGPSTYSEMGTPAILHRAYKM